MKNKEKEPFGSFFDYCLKKYGQLCESGLHLDYNIQGGSYMNTHLNLYGTNLDGNMVVLAPQHDSLDGVVRILSDLLEDHEQYVKVKRVETDKPLHGGRKPEYKWEKDRLELVPLKGIQVVSLLTEEMEEKDGYTYTIPYESYNEYHSIVPIKKNQPLLIRGFLFKVEDVEKTGKKSGIIHVVDYRLSSVLQHFFIDNRWSKKQGRFVPVGMNKTHREHVLRKLRKPELDPE